jgi:DNA segregation ATPase FtsK/SpoIIIE-like protein
MNKTEYWVVAMVLAATLSMGAFVPEAHALRGRGAAFVVGASVGAAGSSTANANAAASQQQAATAQQQAATAQQQAEVEKQKAITAQQQAEAEKQKAIAAQQQAAQAGAAGKPLPAGTVVAKLPPGCTPTPVGGKNYQYCGGTFYEPVYEGSTLKYVTTTPK